MFTIIDALRRNVCDPVTLLLELFVQDILSILLRAATNRMNSVRRCAERVFSLDSSLY